MAPLEGASTEGVVVGSAPWSLLVRARPFGWIDSR